MPKFCPDASVARRATPAKVSRNDVVATAPSAARGPAPKPRMPADEDAAMEPAGAVTEEAARAPGTAGVTWCHTSAMLTL